MRLALRMLAIRRRLSPDAQPNYRMLKFFRKSTGITCNPPLAASKTQAALAKEARTSGPWPFARRLPWQEPPLARRRRVQTLSTVVSTIGRRSQIRCEAFFKARETAVSTARSSSRASTFRPFSASTAATARSPSASFKG